MKPTTHPSTNGTASKPAELTKPNPEACRALYRTVINWCVRMGIYPKATS